MTAASKKNEGEANWYRMQRPRLLCGFVRLIIWMGAIWIVVYPAILISHSDWSLNIDYLGKTINNAGDYKEFFFITIVVSVIGLSNIFDNISTSRRTGHFIGDLTFLCFSILGAIFIFQLLYSIPHFVEIAEIHGKIDEGIVNHDYAIIRNILIVGLLTELVIASRERPPYIPVTGVAAGNAPTAGSGPADRE